MTYPSADTVPVRWPLHPPPDQLESLSSWLDRIAVLYRLTTEQLIGPQNLPVAQPYTAYRLDVDPPPAVLAALSKRTGVPVERLQAMTLAGWVPCLSDELPPVRSNRVLQVFYNYIRDNPVLFPLGESRIYDPEGRSRRWAGPWQPPKPLNRTCPVCLTEPGRGQHLMWRLPLQLGCGVHGCYLDDLYEATYHSLLHDGRPMPPRPLPEPLATLERYTHSALTTGFVDLPGRAVPAAVWFRLLRALLDEVSLAASTLHTRPRATLTKIWETTGLPPRAGLNVWTPYEVLDPEQQHAMMTAAATALDLAARGDIVAEGRLGSAIQPPAPRHVYSGDKPAPRRRTAWDDLLAEAEKLLQLAKTDPDVARDVLQMLTRKCRTLDRFEEQRSFLFGAGVPTQFLPSAADIARTDLT
ncbi:TniQ family protein [Kribbella sp. NPDC058245]|uniref:TniQ family protein n=1 Tax=Kribbella sp. NPDC058245 TaxID=3346399 RepID=UPI0036E851EB